MKKTNTTTAVATTKKATVKKTAVKTTAVANIEKFDKVLTMEELKALAHKNQVCFIASNNQSTQYRIFNGKSSIHIQKTQYKVYATNDDFINLQAAGKFECVENGNHTDGIRPNLVIVKPEDIGQFIGVMALNGKNHMQ